MIGTGIRYNPNTASGSVFGGLLYSEGHIFGYLVKITTSFINFIGLVPAWPITLVETNFDAKRYISVLRLVSYVFSIIRRDILVGTTGLNQMVQLVQQLLGGAVDLCIGLAHVLVQGLVRMDRTFKVCYIRTCRVRTQVAPHAPLWNILPILKILKLNYNILILFLLITQTPGN
jgi:hypothetical protein